MAGLAELLRSDVERAARIVRDQYRAARRVEAGCFVVTGSGDNYALALAAPHLSRDVIAAPFDPLQLHDRALAAMLAARGCVLVALSVGGRTRAVVSAARLYRDLGGRVVAVTAEPSSPLAAAADDVVVLLHGGTAGGVGAGRHLLALAALAGVLGVPEPRVEELGGCPGELVGEGVVYAGYMESIGSALFSALKVYEVYGLPVQWWQLEQLVHAPVYAARGNVIVYHASTKPSYAGEAVEALREAGYNVLEVPGGRDPASTLLSQTLWLLRCLSQRSDLPEKPSYRGHAGLEVLTRLIYGQP